MPLSLKRFTTSAAAGFLRGSGEKVISVPSPASPVIDQIFLGDQRVAAHQDGVHALVAHLADDQAGLGVIAAEE